MLSHIGEEQSRNIQFRTAENNIRYFIIIVTQGQHTYSKIQIGSCGIIGGSSL
jgi:hypothetical protein